MGASAAYRRAVPPTSLIFLVIIGVWAVFIVQFAVRRREHALTARTVDELSHAMRVLETRAAPAARATEPASQPILTAPASSAPTSDSSPASPAATPAPPASPAVGHASARAGDRRITRPRPARPVRGLALVAALLTFVVTAPLAAFSVVSWMAPAAAAMALVAAFAWLRSCVRIEEAARARARERRAARRARPAAVALREAPSIPVESPSAGVDVDAADLESEEFVSVELVHAPDPAPVLLVDEDDIPLTWDPVPLPRPTYTLKARAPEVSAGVPARDGEAGQAPVSAQENDETAYELPERRVSGG